MPDIRNCGTCKAKIMWCRTVGGHLIALDAEPVASGNIQIIDGIANVRYDPLLEPMLPDEPRYQSHAASCAGHPKQRRKKS